MPSNSPRYSLVHEDFDKEDNNPAQVVSPRHGSLYRILFFALAIVNVALMLVGGVFGLFNRERFVGSKDFVPQTFVPEIPSRYVTFELDQKYIDSVPGDKGSPWNDLIPLGRGFVDVDNAEKYGLSGGYETDHGTELYAISMFHQIHCLGSLKMVFTSLLPGDYTAPMRDGHRLKPEHVVHCFDFLRQAIMCSGDLTLEGGKLVDGKPANDVNGWGMTHQCRDWDTMFNFSIDNRGPSNSSGIL